MLRENAIKENLWFLFVMESKEANWQEYKTWVSNEKNQRDVAFC